MRSAVLLALVASIPAVALPSGVALSEAVVGLLDGGPRPAGVDAPLCRTSVLREAMAAPHALTPTARALMSQVLARPAGGDVVPIGGLGWLHGSPGSREREELLLAAVESAVVRIRGVAGNRTFPRAPIDVYLEEPQGAAGSVVWDAAGVPVGVMLSPALSDGDLVRELGHQLFHLWQLEAWPHDAPPSWFEGAAVYVSCDASAARLRLLADAVEPAIARPAEPLDSLEPDLLRSRASLPAFLCEAAGAAGDVRPLQVLSRNATQSASWSRALGLTLEQLGLGSPAAFQIQHAIWLALVGEWGASGYYSFATQLQPAPLPALGPEAVVLHLGPGGRSVHALDPVPREGGYWVTVRPGSPGIRGAIVLRGAAPARELRIVPIPVLADGTMRIGVPVRVASGSLVVLVNVTAGEVEGRAWSEHDAVFPFALSSLTTEPTAEGVLIRWTVAEERGLLGWRVMRSRDPSHGFAPVTRLPLPGRGVATDPLTYYFLDQTARPGQRYYYYLEGVSDEGLPQPSFVVNVTTERP